MAHVCSQNMHGEITVNYIEILRKGCQFRLFFHPHVRLTAEWRCPQTLNNILSLKQSLTFHILVLYHRIRMNNTRHKQNAPVYGPTHTQGYAFKVIATSH
jgi:hypothetical protein